MAGGRGGDLGRPHAPLRRCASWRCATCCRKPNKVAVSVVRRLGEHCFDYRSLVKGERCWNGHCCQGSAACARDAERAKLENLQHQRLQPVSISGHCGEVVTKYRSAAGRSCFRPTIASFPRLRHEVNVDYASSVTNTAQ